MMRKIIKSTICTLLVAATYITSATAQEQVDEAAQPKAKPSVNVGLLLHTSFQIEQNGYGMGVDQLEDIDNPSGRSYGISLSRARLLFNVDLTPKDYIYVATELSASVGLGRDKAASVKILDAAYSHRFLDQLTISAGKMIASYNRNGMQSAYSMMANDFGYFLNAHSGGPLNNDAGRDVGVNLSGGFWNDNLTYNLGTFSGCRDYSLYTGEESAPLRFVGRLQYNILDVDKYAGTNLGEGRTFSIGAGFDNQGSYYAVGGDLYLDAPLGKAGSFTLNTAYSYVSGGKFDTKYNFASVIADSNIVFAEAGYYIKKLKLQPWVKYELMDRRVKGLVDENVLGGGINYFFNGYGSNLRVSYVARKNSQVGEFYGQTWIQAQFYIF